MPTGVPVDVPVTVTLALPTTVAVTETAGIEVAKPGSSELLAWFPLAGGVTLQVVTIEGSGDVPTIEAAVLFLRMALFVLIQNQDYLKPERIDEDLIPGKLASADAAE